MPSPPFTLIFGAYDHERYLEAAVRSVLGQTTPFDRVIFFSDGSKDGTLSLARKLLGSDRRVTFLDDLETNRGLVPRLNQAAGLIRDGYIVGLSGDDVLAPDACETFRCLADRTGFQWAMGATQITDADLHPTRLVDPARLQGETRAGIFERLLRLDPWIPAQGWCYSAELLRRVGGYDARHQVEDYSLGLRLARAAIPRLTGALVSHYRVHDASWSSYLRAERMWCDHARVALEFVASAPRTALSAASSFRYIAASIASEHGARARAFRHAAASVALYPHRPRIRREVEAILRPQGPA